MCVAKEEKIRARNDNHTDNRAYSNELHEEANRQG